ncbi:MAG: hypothetical protein HGA78_02905 [Nitrospirales bacterium]|nr:hypothetical protein [Nitrospirales bacterium]
MAKPQRLIIALSVTALLSLQGCGGTREVHIQSPADMTPKLNVSKERVDTVLQSAMAQAVNPNSDYIIGPEDLLAIEVFQVDELKKVVRVSSQGYIALPLVGQIQAKGLTAADLEKEIAKKLDNYLQEPTVSVFISEYRGQKIGVIGAVKAPQVYSVIGQKYLLDMLSMAGGVNGSGGTCYVLRPSRAENGEAQTETIVINLKDLLEKGDVRLNIPVFGGDVINVPSGGVVFVDGAVNRPGAFPIQGDKTTLVQAIALAGGIKFEATSSEIKIFRENGTGQRDIISADYDEMQAGKRDDICLKDNDTIMVPANGLKSFISSVLHFGGTLPIGGASMSVTR